MGVMLSLDRHRPDAGRRRAQHARRPDAQARVRALATVRRLEAPVSGRLLGRLARSLLAWRKRPARRAAGRPSADAPGERARSLYPELSVACLRGECRDDAGRQACDVGSCEHDCHRGAAGPGAGAGAGRAPAA